MVLEELALGAVVAGDELLVHHSASHLAERLGRSRDSITRALRQLVELGVAERVEHRDDVSGRFSGVHYRLRLDATGLELSDQPRRPRETEAVDLPGSSRVVTEQPTLAAFQMPRVEPSPRPPLVWSPPPSSSSEHH